MAPGAGTWWYLVVPELLAAATGLATGIREYTLITEKYILITEG